MKRKPPVLTSKDLANIRTLIQSEVLASNKEVRKELARLRKENAELRKDITALLELCRDVEKARQAFKEGKFKKYSIANLEDLFK